MVLENRDALVEIKFCFTFHKAAAFSGSWTGIQSTNWVEIYLDQERNPDSSHRLMGCPNPTAGKLNHHLWSLDADVSKALRCLQWTGGTESEYYFSQLSTHAKQKFLKQGLSLAFTWQNLPCLPLPTGWSPNSAWYSQFGSSLFPLITLMAKMDWAFHTFHTYPLVLYQGLSVIHSLVT